MDTVENDELIARLPIIKLSTGEISDPLARSKGPTGFSLCGANTRAIASNDDNDGLIRLLFAPGGGK